MFGGLRTEDGLEVVQHLLLLGRVNRKIDVQLDGMPGARLGAGRTGSASEYCLQTGSTLHFLSLSSPPLIDKVASRPLRRALIRYKPVRAVM